MIWIATLLARWGVKEGLAAKLAPWVAGAALVAIIGLLAALLMAIADRWHENTIAVATEAGATGAVVAGQAQTLDQLGDANHAEQNLRSSGERDPKRYAGCLLDSRDKARCERFNPAGE
jgi:hypothetical protein